MKFPSNILSIFSQHAGTIDPRDGVMTVPNVISPTLEVPTPLSILGNGAGFPKQLSSFMLDFVQSVTNAAGNLDVSIVLVGSGLWEFIFSLNFASDNPNINQQSGLYIRDTQTSLTATFQYFYGALTAATQLTWTQRYRLSCVPVSTLDIRAFVDNTAAGKTTILSGSIIGNRLG